ncbi:unnamed protein product [Rhodiola kirilowii]
MFYSQFILAKKGPLGTIWIAAHLERKLRKNQVADTDIGVSVDSIIFPEVPIALRLSSHLLLGVVRIYSRKVNYLFDDCSEALLKVKQAFRSTAVDLPPEESTAPYHSITLPETFDLDDFELPDADIFQGNYVDHHISNKEQITLQDTMDGVVYSTSQFGLDERFGDGDASQIGLDLEEDLLLNKLPTTKTAADGMDLDDVPNTSTHPDESIKNENNGEMSETSETVHDTLRGPEVGNGNDELVEYAQAPATPGLVEEPNLSNQKTSACDDQFEPENHLTESITHENLTETFHALPPHMDVAVSPEPETICTVENGHNLTEPKIKQSELESDSNLDTQDATLGVMKKPQDRYREDVEIGDKVPSPNILGEACDLSNSSDQPCSNTGQPENYSLLSNGFQLDGQETILPETSEEIAVANQREELFSPKKMLASSGLGSLDAYSLQACNSDVKLHDILSKGKEDTCLDQQSKFPETLDKGEDVQADSMKVQDPQHIVTSSGNFQAPDTIESVDGMNQSADTGQPVQANHSEIHEKAESSITKHTNEVSMSFPMPELPAREKLLSAPEVHAELPSNLLSDTTPEKVMSTIDEDGAGVITGQKRSFTESTLTVDSLHTAESSGKDRLKKSAESIPDDEDLLSSILVGRRSTILKLKPTPIQTEVVSMKRPRVTSRNITYKRKVLMDETMVLHGDTIREQLVTTEDIRRVRKKAPCTHREIWMIQKQFLEEDIVYDPISTGMSMDLVCLHNQAYELSGISIQRVDESVNPMDSTLEMQPPQDKIIIPETQENGIEKINVETQLGSSSVEIGNQPGEGDTSLLSHDDGELPKGDSIASLPTLLEQPPISEMEVDGEGGAVVEAAAHASSSPIDTSSPACLIPADIPETAAGSATPLPEETIDSSNANYEASSFYQSKEEKDDHSHVAVIYDGDGSPLHVESGTRNELSLNEVENGGSLKDIASPEPPTASETCNLDHGICSPTRALDTDGNNEAGMSLSVVHDVNAEKHSPNGGQNEHVDEFDAPQVQATVATDTDCALIEDYNFVGVSYSFQEDLIFFHQKVVLIFFSSDLQGMNYTTAEHDTGFLNVDDDDLEEDESYMPSVQESRTRIVDSSGWSSRSRAVSKYLQIMFDKQAEHGKNLIAMDNLLTGKSRKEASRMFFETLVLKTRDYIQVEQNGPFNDINLRPRSMLMKSDF